MKERLVTLGFALGAVLLFVAMFVREEAALERGDSIPRPTTAERRGNGYQAAVAWLEAEGIRTISLREGFDSLPDREDLPPRGNLLIVTLPATEDLRTEELMPLDQWVRAGNTLLVLAALSDNPDWAFARGGPASSDLSLLTGLEFETVRARAARLGRRGAAEGASGARGARTPEDAAPSTSREGAPEGSADVDLTAAFRAYAQPKRSVLLANRAHAYFSDVDEVVALSDYPQQAWTVKVPYEGFVFALGRDAGTGEGVLWTRPLGEGRVIVSGFGSLFTNRALGLADNAQLLANIVATNVSEEGAVLFDDVHQGLGATYDPGAFYSDRRLYLSVAILVALWLVWVLGSTRLRASGTRVPAPREAELVRTTGHFFARVLPVHAAACRLVDNFLHRVAERSAQRPGIAEAWEYLERHPRVKHADIELLKRWNDQARAAKRVPLVQLHNLIMRIDRQIT